MSDSNNKEILIEAPIKVKGEDDQTIKEFKLSWAGKIFFAGAAAYILGSAGRQQKIPIKVRGTPQQVKAIVDAVISSKQFQQELSRPGATVDSVIDKLRLRNISKNQFQQLTGRPWPI